MLATLEEIHGNARAAPSTHRCSRRLKESPFWRPVWLGLAYLQASVRRPLTPGDGVLHFSSAQRLCRLACTCGAIFTKDHLVWMKGSIPGVNDERGLRRVIFAAVLVMGALTIANYARVFITTYAQNSLMLPANLAFGATVTQGVCTLFAAPLAGFLADTFGRKRIALTALPLCIIVGPLAFIAINHIRTAAVVYAATSVLSFLGMLIDWGDWKFISAGLVSNSCVDRRGHRHRDDVRAGSH